MKIKLATGEPQWYFKRQGSPCCTAKPLPTQSLRKRRRPGFCFHSFPHTMGMAHPAWVASLEFGVVRETGERPCFSEVLPETSPTTSEAACKLLVESYKPTAVRSPLSCSVHSTAHRPRKVSSLIDNSFPKYVRVRDHPRLVARCVALHTCAMYIWVHSQTIGLSKQDTRFAHRPKLDCPA